MPSNINIVVLSDLHEIPIAALQVMLRLNWTYGTLTEELNLYGCSTSARADHRYDYAAISL